MTADNCLGIYDPSQYDSLQAYADAMNAQLQGKTASEIIEWTLETFGAQHTALSSSFGITSAVMLNLTKQHAPGVPVIWIDTGYLPAETYRFADKLTKSLDLDIRVFQSPVTPARMEALYGKLYEIPTEAAHKQYGYLRKVEPMQRALEELQTKALLAGVRAEQTANRQQMQIVNVYEGRLKICPILQWTKQDVEKYMSVEELPYHPLKYEGYVSVGDWHSSRPVAEGEEGNERAGRFHGVSQECGLHVDMADVTLEDLKVQTGLTAKEEEIKEKVAQPNGIVIVSKPTCKFCNASKDEFKQRGWTYEDFTVGQDISIPAVQEIVGKPVKTVPQIWKDGQYIGGYTELAQHLGIPSRFA